MTQKSTSLEDFAIVSVGRSDYRILSWFMSKDEAVRRMKNKWKAWTTVKKQKENLLQ